MNPGEFAQGIERSRLPEELVKFHKEVQRLADAQMVLALRGASPSERAWLEAREVRRGGTIFKPGDETIT